MKLAIFPAVILATIGSAQAATLQQTVHFTGTTASELATLYLTGEGQAQITGVPATYVDDQGDAVERASPGDRLRAFCFEPDMCSLEAELLAINEAEGVTAVVMSWWNFGWASAADPADYTVEGRGAPDSTLVLTFRDTSGGAEVQLVQVNVPDYKVVIPNPDGSTETGPLSRIVNTHWNTLYWDGVRRLTRE